ncbi:MAG: Mut7-C RNAse domain-containing protein [Candidatus Binatia bacterium]
MSCFKGQAMTQREPVLPIMEIAPRFLVDRMLGRLAKWLRILGYDSAYLPQLSPQGLMREGRQQGRIILTRDTRFLRQKNSPPFVFIRDDRFRDQLRQVMTDCQLAPLSHLLTRCSDCNCPLEEIPKEQVQDRVPAYVWQTQDAFYHCARCRRIYWGATHKERILDELRHLRIVET